MLKRFAVSEVLARVRFVCISAHQSSLSGQASQGDGRTSYAQFCDLLRVEHSPTVQRLFQMFGASCSVCRFPLPPVVSPFCIAPIRHCLIYFLLTAPDDGDAINVREPLVLLSSYAGWTADEQRQCTDTPSFHTAIFIFEGGPSRHVSSDRPAR